MSKKSLYGILSLCFTLIIVSVLSIMILIPAVSSDAQSSGKVYTLSGGSGTYTASSTDATNTDATDTDATGSGTNVGTSSDASSKDDNTTSTPSDSENATVSEDGAPALDILNYDDVVNNVIGDDNSYSGIVLVASPTEPSMITSDLKAEFEKVLGSDYELYEKLYDINLYKVSAVDGKLELVEKLSKPIEFSIEVPEDIQADGMLYALAKKHGTDPAELLADDESGETITVSISKFSTFAFGSKDTSELNTESKDKVPTKTTGDSTNARTYLFLTLVGLAAAACLVVVNKKYRSYSKLNLD
ncbi:MAG: hypothetical protein ACI4II_08580 [Acutalibacteraceae bacterium]